MARSTRDARLETRATRLKLAAGVRFYRGVANGLALSYRRTSKGYGSWHARFMASPGKYRHRQLGAADDFQDADGTQVLTFFQAQEKARELVAAQRSPGTRPYTVNDAIDDYLRWFKAHRKAYRETRLACQAHITPRLGARAVEKLTAPEIRRWHESLAAAAPRIRSAKGATRPTFKEVDQTHPDYQRRRQQSANRILTILKAALNMAFRDEQVKVDSAWRRVKPFRSTGGARIRFLSLDECTRLLNASDKDFRALMKSALLTGCRYGELATLRAGDFVPEGRCVQIRHSKSGRPRTVPLTGEGMAFFTAAAAGKLADSHLLVRSDGSPWGASHQARPLAAACHIAKITPAVSFHILRHTYASHLAMAGVPLQAIAAVLGHADTRITEKHYAHLQPSFVADAVRSALPQFEVTTSSLQLTPIRPRQAA